MKQTDIKVGRTYANLNSGWNRRVVEIKAEAQWDYKLVVTYSYGVQDRDYKHCTLKTFAAWAEFDKT